MEALDVVKEGEPPAGSRRGMCLKRCAKVRDLSNGLAARDGSHKRTAPLSPVPPHGRPVPSWQCPGRIHSPPNVDKDFRFNRERLFGDDDFGIIGHASSLGPIRNREAITQSLLG